MMKGLVLAFIFMLCTLHTHAAGLRDYTYALLSDTQMAPITINYVYELSPSRAQATLALQFNHANFIKRYATVGSASRDVSQFFVVAIDSKQKAYIASSSNWGAEASLNYITSISEAYSVAEYSDDSAIVSDQNNSLWQVYQNQSSGHRKFAALPMLDPMKYGYIQKIQFLSPDRFAVLTPHALGLFTRDPSTQAVTLEKEIEFSKLRLNSQGLGGPPVLVTTVPDFRVSNSHVWLLATGYFGQAITPTPNLLCIDLKTLDIVAEKNYKNVKSARTGRSNQVDLIDIGPTTSELYFLVDGTSFYISPFSSATMDQFNILYHANLKNWGVVSTNPPSDLLLDAPQRGHHWFGRQKLLSQNQPDSLPLGATPNAVAKPVNAKDPFTEQDFDLRLKQDMSWLRDEVEVAEFTSGVNSLRPLVYYFLTAMTSNELAELKMEKGAWSISPMRGFEKFKISRKKLITALSKATIREAESCAEKLLKP